MQQLKTKLKRKLKGGIICIILPFIFVLLNSTIQAQQVIPAAGGNATGSGGSVSFTVGQIVYSTQSGTNGSVAEGVQQPYEISEVMGIKEARDISLLCTVFPNPTNDFITLKIENYKIKNISYLLSDINGKLLDRSIITDEQTDIVMGNIPPGTYFLQIINKKRKIKTFKIVRN
ncbi:T9SS type A sorting domain-containing protein [Bacteroidota bacterium]